MEKTIKDEVKNIFNNHSFESALELTRNLRGEYLAEYGVKSWNSLVTYYSNPEKKKIENNAVEVAAEPEAANSTTEEVVEEVVSTEDADECCSSEDTVDEGITVSEIEVGDLHAIISNAIGESSETDSPLETDEDKVEYMLYRNTGDEVEWFGHRENFYGLEPGDEKRLIRMNNKGVSEAMVVATTALTLDQIDIFHKCYAVVIRTKFSYKEQVKMAANILLNIPDATKDASKLPSNPIKLTDYINNYNK